MRSPFLAIIPAALALGAGLLRWVLQGSGNLYTATARRAYVPDPDLGWRVVDGGPPWLGLEVLAVILAVLCGVIVGAWLIRRLERRRPRALLRGALWVISVAPLAVPAWAFAGGFGPSGARDALPRSAATAPTEGIDGALAAPAGRWEAITHAGSAVTARVSAGGEGFDARFAGGLTGHWTGDPGDLRAPMSAEITVATASVDTGVKGRSTSAAYAYLDAGKHPAITFRLTGVTAAQQDGPDRLSFRGHGVIGLVGREHPLPITGTLKLLDDDARARLGLPGEAPAMLAEADLKLTIADTVLAPDAGDFDGEVIPVHVSLVLVHRP